MSELFDDDPAALPPRPSRRAKIMVGAVVGVIVVFFAITTFASLYTDGLWFGSLGFGSVFWRLFWTKALLFVCAFAVMALALLAAMVLAFRARPFYHPAEEHGGLVRYREAVNPIRGWLMTGLCAVSGAFAGVSGTSHWRTFMLWWHGVPFGQQDGYFHKDIGFYVFDLPWWHFVVNLLLAASILALLASLAVHYLYGGIRLSGSRDRFSASAQVQLSVLVGLCLVVKAVDYWLDRYDLVHDDGPLFTGVGYTDDHAVLPGKNILAGVALICAVLFFVNAWRRTWVMPTVGVALMLASAILLGLIWPAIVQGFQVKPSQSDKERDYLAANIAATRTAYQIDDTHVKVESYTNDADAATTSAAALDADAASVPIVDPSLAQQEYEQNQQGKSFYTVNEPLDVDHYEIDGNDRALVLGVRELDQSGLNTSDQNWTNLHTVYTHGNGVIAAYGNQRDRSDKTERSTTQYAEGNREDDLEKYGPGDFEDQIYFGEDSPDYSIVGRSAGEAPVELDTGNDGVQGTTTYAGKGGVSISSKFRRLMYAVKFGSANFLLSERVNDDSKVLYDRNPIQRVEKVAPWLTLDDDVYPVVANGRILWVVDGYTTTDLYPGSERESFATMTDDATQTQQSSTVPTDEINYMRNAVKATVDAYDGTVTLYAWDETDPMLKAWESAFPGTVQPKSAIPEEVMEHLRYPEDLYKVQRYQLAHYHVTDATSFLQASDWWDVPTDPTSTDTPHLQTPYRMFVDTPTGSALDPAGGSQQQVWSLTSTFVPYQRQNLAAIMTVDSDATSADYGTIRLLEGFDQQADGPGLVFQAFRTDTQVSNAIASFNRNYTPSYGNVLTLPTADHGLLYLEPVYVAPAASTSSYPVLAYVLVSYDGQIGVGKTLHQAISSALSRASGGSPPSNGNGKNGKNGNKNGGKKGNQGGTTSVEERVATLLTQADRLFDRADAAGRSGDYALRETLLAQARQKVARAHALLVPSSPATTATQPSSPNTTPGT